MENHISDHIFHNLRKEYLDSLTGEHTSSDQSVIYRFFYEQEIVPYMGDPYNYHSNQVTAREARSFRYQIMEHYNTLYQAVRKGKHTRELPFTQCILQSVERIPKRYTDGVHAAEDLFCYQPLIFKGLDYSLKQQKEFCSHQTFYAYTSCLSDLYRLTMDQPGLMRTRLARVELSEYKAIADQLLRSSLHGTIYDFLYNMGYSPVRSDPYSTSTPRKNDRAIELINRYCAEHPEVLHEYSDTSIMKRGSDTTDYERAYTHSSDINRSDTIKPYVSRNNTYGSDVDSSEKNREYAKKEELYNRIYENLSDTGNRDLFVPLQTDPVGVGIYIIGRNYYQHGISTKTIPEKYRKYCCSLGIIIHRTREPEDHSESELYSEIITEFNPLSDYSDSDLHNRYQIAVSDTRRLLQEYNSRISTADSDKRNELEGIYQELENMTADTVLSQYFRPSSRQTQRDAILAKEQALLDRGRQDYNNRKNRSVTRT